MSQFFNDSPIERPEDDRYGISAFAATLAKSLLGIANPVGTTLAINGPWGSGKSSAVNLIRSNLSAQDDGQLTVVDFKCWWYRGEEAIALAFLQELHTQLKASLGDKVKDLVPQIGRHVLQAGPVLGSAVALTTTAGWGALVAGSAAFAKRFFPDKDSLEKTFRKLSKVLAAQSRRFLIIVDDIDRLAPDEALAIFRLVKSVGRLPNVMYLLVFDRTLADATVAERYPSEGPHFLEKIIQASFELPPPMPSDLNNALLVGFQDLCGSPAEEHVVRFMNLFYDVVAPYLSRPRHVTRLINAVSVTWPPVADNVSRADYLALEALRLYEPELYRAIRTHRDIVTSTTRSNKADETRFDAFLLGIAEGRREAVKVVLQRLFPAFERISYSGAHAIWEAERRVCIAKHFDTYFKLSLSEDTLSAAEIGELIARADDREFIKQRLLRAAAQVRRDGKTMVPVVLDELTSRGREVPREKVKDFFSALFQVADAVALKQDEERGFAIATTHLRFHWLIRRVTEDRFTLDERSELYAAALERAALGWLVDFACSVHTNYHPREGRSVDLSTYLVAEATVPLVVAKALQAIREAARDDSLLQHPELMSCLYRWRDFAEDKGAEMKAWLAEQMRRDDVLVLLAKALTAESWTTSLGGFGSLGDRVARRSLRAQVGTDFDLFDSDQFRAELERIVRERQVAHADLQAVGMFLEALSRRRAGRDE